jgi:hypothetical protein
MQSITSPLVSSSTIDELIPPNLSINFATTSIASAASGFKLLKNTLSERGEILKLTNGSYYQVPVIQFEDRIVYESGTDTLDVARFVDKEFGQDKLFPKKFEGLQQIIVPYIENDVEGTTFQDP